jgi:tRNA-2-methylthio-N6-dimethylallyladenosine synthase
LIEKIRRRIPEVAIHTDIIVGFPGETEAQFMETYKVLADLKLDKAHVAMYSPRPNTVSDRSMDDDVPGEEKYRRLQMIDQLQAEVLAGINQKYLGQTQEVLVEDLHQGKWRGRTRLNKLVFFEDSADWRGRLAEVEITWTGPWSMRGRLPEPQSESVVQQSVAIPLTTLA